MGWALIDNPAVTERILKHVGSKGKVGSFGPLRKKTGPSGFRLSKAQLQ